MKTWQVAFVVACFLFISKPVRADTLTEFGFAGSTTGAAGQTVGVSGTFAVDNTALTALEPAGCSGLTCPTIEELALSGAWSLSMPGIGVMSSTDSGSSALIEIIFFDTYTLPNYFIVFNDPMAQPAAGIGAGINVSLTFFQATASASSPFLGGATACVAAGPGGFPCSGVQFSDSSTGEVFDELIDGTASPVGTITTPEPSVMFLLSAGLICLMAGRRWAPCA